MNSHGPDARELKLRYLLGVLAAILIALVSVSCGKKEEGPVSIILYGFMGSREQGLNDVYIIKEESNYVKFRLGDTIYTHSGKYLIMRATQ